MEILTEAGAIGLVLYVAVFVTAGWLLTRIVRASTGGRRHLAAGLAAAFAAHLVAGTFLSNPSLVWTYVLLGVAAAVISPSSDENRQKTEHRD